MAAGDFILNPSWSWHDHANPTDQPVVWFDGHDTPLATQLGSNDCQDHPDTRQTPVRGASSLLRQPWDVTDRALTRLFRDPTRIASTEFTDPSTGGPICPTFDCWMHRLGPTLSAPATRKTGNSIFVVFTGSGTTSVGPSRFAWATGDVFVAPSWAAVRHHPSETSNLFELTDRPTLKALGLYRQEALS
jgi:gentisate 1,2-dioxygenase